MATVAINGLGRIGRAALRILLETPELEVVAVNDLTDLEELVYLLRYDTVYGRLDEPVRADDGKLEIGGRVIRALSEGSPAALPWGECGVDLVLECTGAFRRRGDLEQHLDAGARHVILSAPAKGDDLTTVVYGVNDTGEETPAILSTASCTTNCIAPVAEILGRRVGVRKALMTTVHAYTSSQGLVDGPSKRPERGRAAAANLIPTSTGAAQATAETLPQYADRFDGLAIRVPVPVGSVTDMTFLTSRETSVEELDGIFREEANGARYAGVLGVVDEPIVSSDIVMDPRASIVDLGQTRVVDGDLVKLLAWYDNEWGYASQMVRQALRMLGVARGAP